MSKELVVISKNELAAVEDNLLNEKQLNLLLQKTPEKHIYKRPAKGGGQWDYVTGVYVKKKLNLMFGWDWDFLIVEHKIDLDIGQAYVLGKLKVRTAGREIIKMQFGRVDIKFKKSTQTPLDVGNDLKAAATDALKKCAAELGVASDVYAPNEFKAIQVVESTDISHESLKDFFNSNEFDLSEDNVMNIERILETEEEASYLTAWTLLQKTIKK